MVGWRAELRVTVKTALQAPMKRVRSVRDGPAGGRHVLMDVGKSVGKVELRSVSVAAHASGRRRL
jgi:hypothetical protein